jgi:DnaK suppressor protein
VDKIVAALENKQATLEAELARMSAPPPDAGGISFGKRVGEGTSMAVDRLVDVAAHDQLRAVLADVRRALTKFEEGTYGSCDSCGRSIPPARLEMRPWATLCVGCAQHKSS